MVPISTPQQVEHAVQRVRQAFSFLARSTAGRWYDHVATRPIEPHVLEALAELYAPLEPLRRCDSIYPVLLVSTDPLQIDAETGPDPVLVRPEGGWHQQEAASLYFRKKNYRRIRRIVGSPVQAWNMYRMLSIEGQTIRADLGRYDYMLDTCESLEWELRKRLRRLNRRPARSPERLLRRLPKRRGLHQRVRSPATSGEGRSASIAVSVLTAYWHQGTWRLLVRRRSSRGVAVESNLIHVLPSFMLAPEHGHRDDEFSLLHNIRREFAEELFGLKAERDAEYLWFEHAAPVADLDQMLMTGKAELWITGLVVNTLTLRPEVCALLWIKDREWYARCAADESGPLKVNEEFATQQELSRRGARDFIPNVVFRPGDADRDLQTRACMTPTDSVPVGAAAYWLGVDMLRRRMAALEIDPETGETGRHLER